MKFSRELSIICCAAALLIATPGIAAAQNGLAAQQAAAARAKAAQQAAAQAAAARAKAAQQAAAQAAAAARAKAAQQAAAAQAKAAQQAATQAAAAKAKAAQQAAAQAAAAQAKAAQQAAAEAAVERAKAAQQAARGSSQKLNIPSQPKVASPKPNGIQPTIAAPNVAQPKVLSSKPNTVQPKIAAPKSAVVAPTASAPAVSTQKSGGTPSGGEAGGSGSSRGGSVAANPGSANGTAPTSNTASAIKVTLPPAQLNMQPSQQSAAAPANPQEPAQHTAGAFPGIRMLGGSQPTNTAQPAGPTGKTKVEDIKVTLPTQHLDMNKPSGGEAGGSGSSGGDSVAREFLTSPKSLEFLKHLIMKPVMPSATTDRKTTAINSNQAIPLATTDGTVATTLNPVARPATEPTQDVKITPTAAPSNQAIPLVTTPLATTDNAIATPFNATHLAPSTVLDTLNLPTLKADSQITPRANTLATTFSADQVTNVPSATLGPSATLDVSATKGVLITPVESKRDPFTGWTKESKSERVDGKTIRYNQWCTSGECFWLPSGVDPSMRNYYTEEAVKARKEWEAWKKQAQKDDREAANALKNMWNGIFGDDPNKN